MKQNTIADAAVCAVTPYAAQLDSNGYGIKPKLNTVLAAMAAQCYPCSTSVDQTGGGRMMDPSFACFDATSKEFLATVRQSVDLLSPLIKEQIRTAQSVVNPVVNAAVERVQEVAKYFVPKSISDFEVIRVSPPPPIENKALLDLIKAYAPEQRLEITPLYIFPNKTGLELLELMTVGNPALDEVTTKWFYTVGENFFQRVWRTYFLSMQFAGDTSNRLDLSRMSWRSDEGMNALMALFLMANRLHDSDSFEGTVVPQGVRLDNARNMLADIRNQAATRLEDAVDELEDLKKTNTLVKFTAPSLRKIYAHNDTYLAWASKTENANEILYGLLVSGDQFKTAEAIMAKADAYKEIYFNTAHNVKEAAQADWANNMRKTLIDCLCEQAQLSLTSSAALANAKEIIKEHIHDLDAARMKTELYNICLEAIHKAIFPGTASLVLLRGINQAKDGNQTLAVREAATVSVLRYICTYVVAMMQVEKLGGNLPRAS